MDLTLAQSACPELMLIRIAIHFTIISVFAINGVNIIYITLNKFRLITAQFVSYFPALAAPGMVDGVIGGEISQGKIMIPSVNHLANSCWAECLFV